MVADFHKKQKNISSHTYIFKIVGLCAVGIVICLIIANIRLHEKGKTLNLQIQNLQNKISGVQKSNESLQEGVARSGDKQYIEKIAREEFDLQQPGEKVVSFTMPENQAPINETAPASFWQAWLGGALDWLKRYTPL